MKDLKDTVTTTKITIADRTGEKIEVTITAIDDPYLENPSYRYMLAGSYSYQMPFYFKSRRNNAFGGFQLVAIAC